MKKTLFLSLIFLTTVAAHAQPAKTVPAITAADIRERESILASDSLEGRRTGEPGAEKAAHYIASEFKRLQLSPKAGMYFQPFSFSEHALDSTKHDKTQGKNVYAFIPGSDPTLTAQYVILGAHYDHLGHGGPFALDSNHRIHYGADDNASG